MNFLSPHYINIVAMNVNVCILMLFKIEEGSRFWCKANLKKNMGFI